LSKRPVSVVTTIQLLPIASGLEQGHNPKNNVAKGTTAHDTHHERNDETTPAKPGPTAPWPLELLDKLGGGGFHGFTRHTHPDHTANDSGQEEYFFEVDAEHGTIP
jgi:hypothetical protein